MNKYVMVLIAGICLGRILPEHFFRSWVDNKLVVGDIIKVREKSEERIKDFYGQCKNNKILYIDHNEHYALVKFSNCSKPVPYTEFHDTIDLDDIERVR